MGETPARGRIITFYSYKGGTGRSMALANVGWILASNGMRVLAVDWDLEGPGLHRYFHPFLSDKDLGTSEGLIDFVVDFEGAAKAPVKTGERADPDWFVPYANILRYAVSLDTDAFQAPGTLDFVPAGRQDAGYAVRVNRFNWDSFYKELGGGVFLEAVKNRLRHEYDYILIDSRTGVSDTSGICTVQMPDDLVVCFTLNAQSMEGASGVAKSALAQRQTRDQPAGLRVWPVPMRVENAEKDKLELARDAARSMFDVFLRDLPSADRDEYWGRVEVLYEPFYAYEEVLATFRDRPSHSKSMLASMEAITDYITDNRVARLRRLPDSKRKELLKQYLRQPRRVEAPRAAALVNLAETLRSQQDYAGARKAMEDAVLVLREKLGLTHPETLSAADKLASMRAEQGDLLGARNLLGELIKIRRELFGEEHPETLTCMNKLAEILRTQGDLDGSLRLQEQVLKISQKELGPVHPGVATSLSNVASTLVDRGNLDEARKVYGQALEIRQQALGPNHPDTISSVNDLAGTLEMQGDLAGARQLFEQVLKRRMQTLGPRDAETATSMVNLAQNMAKQGDLVSARPLLEEALQIHQMAFGPEHPITTVSAWFLYFILQGLGEWEAARTVLYRDLNWLLRRDPATLAPLLQQIRNEVAHEAEKSDLEGMRGRGIGPQVVLLVGETPEVRAILDDAVGSLGWNILGSKSIDHALQRIEADEGDIKVVDLDVVEWDKVELRLLGRRMSRPLRLLVLGSPRTLPKVAEALSRAAPGYLLKPFGPPELGRALVHLVEDAQASGPASELNKSLIGNSHEMHMVRDAILSAAQSRVPVLILGASGTGKSVVARAIHAHGPGKDQPFVTVDCGALPPSVIESELFGYARGAFNGAVQSRKGLFEGAGSGTVFLDEIGELPLELQPLLVHTVDESVIRPLGSEKSVPFKARVLASSSRNLQEAINRGEFRSDLYFRLNALTIEIAPLRQRKADILALVVDFLKRHDAVSLVTDMSSDFLLRLMEYDWPGNVRELYNCIQRALLLSRGRHLRVDDLPPEVAGRNSLKRDGTTLEEPERAAIKQALEAARGNREQAAKLLGISKTAIYRKLKEYGLN